MMDVAERVPPASPPSSDEEVPTWGESKHSDGRPKAMVVVDPYSSGGVLARKVYDRGYHVIRVLSRSSQLMADQSLPAVCNGLDFAATVMVSPACTPVSTSVACVLVAREADSWPAPLAMGWGGVIWAGGMSGYLQSIFPLPPAHGP